MIIDIDRIPETGLKISKEFEFFNTDLVEESATFLEPVNAEVSVKKTGEEILIKGRIRSRLNVICSRCLLPYEFAVDSEFDLVYIPDEPGTIREPEEKEDLSRYFYSDRTIDIKMEVWEQLNLTFPVKPLCTQDCQGICPVCGKIIRKERCSCLRDESDPRLEKLKILLRDKR
jgi:uncharacterized protein